ncbi:MAG: hypothetical protein IPK26_11395 [Planctomycetes bacterium]|nr:hypothetical protein [Planctomycetota bacterium]
MSRGSIASVRLRPAMLNGPRSIHPVGAMPPSSRTWVAATTAVRCVRAFCHA